LEQVKKKDIALGILASKHKDVTLNLFYTPTHLTDMLIFNKEKCINGGRKAMIMR
jgi:hypothetical protein